MICDSLLFIWFALIFWILVLPFTLHKKWSFPLRISSINVTESVCVNINVFWLLFNRFEWVIEQTYFRIFGTSTSTLNLFQNSHPFYKVNNEIWDRAPLFIVGCTIFWMFDFSPIVSKPQVIFSTILITINSEHH